MATADVQVLRLIHESKLADLLPDSAGNRWEASGVAYAEGKAFVVFDDRPVIAVIPIDAAGGMGPGRLIDLEGEVRGFEDIWFHAEDRRFYLLIEAAKAGKKVWKAKVESYDERGRHVETNWLPFEFESENKGFEGIVVTRHEGVEYLLGMCEGNKCRGGVAGAKPGGGRVQVFRREGNEWVHYRTASLPKSVQFEDYASLAFIDRQVAVLSQSTARIWVGRLREDLSEYEDDGRFFELPRDERGKRTYCTLEGMSWMGKGRLVLVSDRMKQGEMKGRCEAKDQSIHVVDV